ncbi:hypothetical protein F5X99DRAFT_401509 [Biscogniauxia marginata]|nr:hypothetical protein F5X99DRAFT_401509 [Biscogniauxia marginata]
MTDVVLADCESTDGVVSSEVAYYSGSPDSSPDDIAQVDTQENTTQQWANSNSSAYFSDTGVTFRATLGPSGQDGDYAGPGNNGYGDFTCWQRTSANLYSHIGKTCSGVYDCDHGVAPSSSASPSVTNASVAAQSSSNSDLSTGAIAGITVGVAVATLSLLSIAAFFLWRRYRPNKPKPAAEFHEEVQGDIESQAKTDADLQQPTIQLMSRSIHELDAETPPVEIQGQPRIELGEVMRFSWLPSPGPPAYDPQTRPHSFGAYGSQKGTL